MSRSGLSTLILISLLWVIVCVRPCCAQVKTWAIHGKSVTEDGVKDGWLIFKDGIIKSVGADDSQVPIDAKQIRWNGYIFPGLIDTHNHVDWNCVPQWTAGPFKSRYDWLGDATYKLVVDVPHSAVKPILDDARKYGELRALIGGTTLLQGSFNQRLPDILVRNLDVRYKALNHVLPKIADLPDDVGRDYLKRLKNKTAADGIQRLFFHVGEGLPGDSTSAAEFAALLNKGFGQEGVVCIHGLAFAPTDFKTMAEQKMHLVWSPVSNWNLYRAIADIPSAIKAGVIVSLAPDWTISGSDNVLEEMKFAYAVGNTKWGEQLTAKDLFKMVTSNAAKVAGVDKDSITEGAPLGALNSGYGADFFLAPSLEFGGGDPYESLLRTYPKHVHLVFIDGKPIYGDKEEMSKLVANADDVNIQNTVKAVITMGGDPSKPGDQVRLPAIKAALEGKLKEVAPLVEN